MTDRAPRTIREPWLFAAVCVVVALAFQGSRGLYETDEGRYAECARAMIASGDWLVPKLQGVPHLTKPPGTYWLVAAGIQGLGANAWGARILLGLAHAAAAWGVRCAGARLCGPAAGARAGWVYLAMFYPFAASSVLTTDTFLAAAVAGSAACLCGADGGRREGVRTLASGALLAAAILVKGHVALVPWSAFAVGWIASDPDRRRARGARACAAFVVGVIAGSLWFVWAAVNVDGAYDHFLGHEVGRRLVSAGDHSPKPFLEYAWYYPAILAAGVTPWWVLVVRGVKTLHRTAAAPTLWLWAAVPLVVFSVLLGKMPLYVLPVAAPLAIWAAAGAPDASSPWPVRPRLLAVWLVALLAIRGGAAVVDDEKDMRALARAVDRANPGWTSPVALLAGRDAQGLDFYTAGRIVRVETPEVRSSRASTTLRAVMRAQRERGERWLVVTEDGDPACERAIARLLGDAPRVVERPRGWLVLEIVP